MAGAEKLSSWSLFHIFPRYRSYWRSRASDHSLGKHVHGQCDDIDISCSLAVAEEGSLDPVRTCKDTELCVADTGAAVVVRMKGEDDAVAVDQMFVEIFHLAREYMRHCVFHCRRKIDDRLVLLRGFPDIKHCVAHFSA